MPLPVSVAPASDTGTPSRVSIKSVTARPDTAESNVTAAPVARGISKTLSDGVGPVALLAHETTAFRVSGRPVVSRTFAPAAFNDRT